MTTTTSRAVLLLLLLAPSGALAIGCKSTSDDSTDPADQLRTRCGTTGESGESKGCSTPEDDDSLPPNGGTPSNNDNDNNPPDPPINSSLPEQLRLSGKANLAAPVTSLSSDKKSLTSLLSGSVASATRTPDFNLSNYTPRLDDASFADIISPSLGDCVAKPALSVGSGGNITFYFFGTDKLPASGCANFAKNASQDGVVVRYTGVPYANSSTKATVTVEIDP